MGIKPEDRPKMIGLLIAIVVLVCYMVIFVVPRFFHTQTAPDAANPAPDAQAAAAPAPAPAGVPAAPVESVGVGNAPVKPDNALIGFTAPPDTAHDPFISPIPQVPAGQAPGTHPPVVQDPQPHPVMPVAAPVPAVPVSPAPAAPGAVAPAAPPPLTLLGTVGGKAAVAVFQSGEAVFEKQPGEFLPNGLRIAAIDDEGVLLEQKGKMYRVIVGSADMQRSILPPSPRPSAGLAARPAAPRANGVVTPVPNRAAASDITTQLGSPKRNSPSRKTAGEGASLLEPRTNAPRNTENALAISPYLSDVPEDAAFDIYRVQLGTFKSLAQAERVVKAAQNKGIEAEVRKTYSNRQTYYTILHSTHETRAEAEQEAQRLADVGLPVHIANPPKRPPHLSRTAAAHSRIRMHRRRR